MTLPPFLQLTAEEEGKVQELAKEVAEQVMASQALQAFCTRSTYVRYLRARSWNVHKAAKMLQETLKWRASYKPEELRWEDLEHEANKGRMYILERRDVAGRPVVLMRPKEDAHNNDNETRLKWLVYILEQASELADAADDGMWTWLIDYSYYTRKAAPPLKVSLATLNILQSHYPERLGRAVCFRPPRIFDLMWRAVWPFIDPVTYQKVVFITKKSPDGVMAEHFELDGIDQTMGGTLTVEQCFEWGRYTVVMQGFEERRQLVLAAAAGAQ